MKLKELLKAIPPCTLVEIEYIQKNKPLVREMGTADIIKYRNQYIVEEVAPFQSILKIKVRERRRKWY